MAHTYNSNYHHVVFSTKGRLRQIRPELQPKLWAYMGGIARSNGFKAIEIGGMPDHAHLLLSLPGKLDIAKAVQLIKGGSSKWVHDSGQRLFEWQEGYGSFTIGVSQIETTVRYIRNQERHHRKMTFEEEFVRFLKKHGIDYDERYVFG